MLSPIPTKKSIVLIAKLLKLNNWLVWSLVILFTLQPTTLLAAEANTPFATIDCPVLANEEIKEDQISAVGVDLIHNINNDLLKGLLIGKSLHYRLRCSPLITGLDETGKSTVSAYNVAKNIVNFGVLIILLVIAFANILRIKLDTYAVKKAVPLLLFGVVMANLGLPIIRTIVDFSEVITSTFIHQASVDGTKTGFVKELINAVYRGGVGAVGTVVNQLNAGGSGFWPAALALVGIPFLAITALGPFAVIIIVGGAFLIFLPSIMFLILGLMFVARIYFIVLLAAVSPIAFASLGFEPLRGKVWGWWWTHFIKWTFMVPISFGLFWLGIVFSRSVGNTMDIGTYVLVLFLIYQATQIPLKLGGAVMSNWNNALVKPISGLINKPFTAAREYVKTSTPKDISRTLSSRGLNFAASFREFGKVREEKAAKQEARSKSINKGREYGELANEIGLGRAVFSKDARQKYNQINSPAAFERIKVLAREKLTGLNIDPNKQNWLELKPEDRAKIDVEIQNLRDSGNTEEIAAAMTINGLLGRKLSATDSNPENSNNFAYYTQALENRRVGSEPAIGLYRNTFQQQTGQIVLTPKDISDLRHSHPDDDALRQAITNKTVENLNNRFNRQKQEEQLKMLRDILAELKSSHVDLSNLENIKNDPDTAAMATFVMQNKDFLKNSSQRLTPDQTEVFAKLEPHKSELGLVYIADLLGADISELLNLLRQRTGETKLRIDSLQILAKPGGVTESLTELIGLPEVEERAVMLAGFDPAIINSIKNRLNIKLYETNRVLSARGVPEAELTKLRESLIQIDNDEIPKLADDSMIDSAITDLNHRKRVKQALETTGYNNIAQNIMHIHNSPQVQALRGPIPTQAPTPPVPPPTSASGPR